MPAFGIRVPNMMQYLLDDGLFSDAPVSERVNPRGLLSIPAVIQDSLWPCPEIPRRTQSSEAVLLNAIGRAALF